MATKNDPGPYDCYASLEADEPYFLLKGRDRHAPLLVTFWAILRRLEMEEEGKVLEAEQVADLMAAWRFSRGKPGMHPMQEEALEQRFKMTLKDDLALPGSLAENRVARGVLTQAVGILRAMIRHRLGNHPCPDPGDMETTALAALRILMKEFR